MSRKQILLVFLLLIFVLCSRLYLLGEVPAGMAWDEAAIGYNGWSIWHTFRDEWLIRLPLSFKSFGDFKAPFAIYLSGFFTTVFGLNLWAVRLPFIISGVFSVLGMILLTRQYLFSFTKKYSNYPAILSGLLLAITPWHFHFTRAAFESGLSMNMTIWGILGLEWSLNLKSQKKHKIILLLSSVILGLTFYTYHSNKLTTPLLILLWLLLHKVNVKKMKNDFLVGFVTLAVILLPFFYDSFFQEGLTRAGLNIFSQLPLKNAIQVFISNLFTHFSPGFLVGGSTTSLRHGDGVYGVFLWPTLILILLGLIWLLGNWRKSRLSLFALGWILIGILPACLGMDVPHSNRALQALPGFILLASLGIYWLWHLKNAYLKNAYLIMIVVANLLVFRLYLMNYFGVYAHESGNDFQYGYEEAINLSEEYLHGNNEIKGEKVVFGNSYGQPYIYALFYKQASPYQYHAGTLIGYEFKDNINIGDLSREKTLVIATENDDIPRERADRVIYGPDDLPRFYLYYQP